MKRIYKWITLLAMLVVLLATMTVFANATELKTGIGIVTASSGLRLRASASTSSKVINTADCGDNVVIIRQKGDWYLVDYNLDIGYMSADYIQVKERENVELGYGSVNPALVNLRSGPSTSYSVVTQAAGSDKVFIFGFNCGWYKVKYSGKVGYIRSDLVTLTEKPYCNSGYSATGGSSSGSSGSSSSSSLGEQIAATAKKYIGCAYVFGGTGPTAFDCSGFVQYIYKLYGISINRTADVQLENGYSVSYSNLCPGDLVFFARTYNTSAAASHVGIYIGNGQFVHAANSSSGVKISDLSEEYYSSRYVGVRRIV